MTQASLRTPQIPALSFFGGIRAFCGSYVCHETIAADIAPGNRCRWKRAGNVTGAAAGATPYTRGASSRASGGDGGATASHAWARAAFTWPISCDGRATSPTRRPGRGGAARGRLWDRSRSRPRGSERRGARAPAPRWLLGHDARLCIRAELAAETRASRRRSLARRLARERRQWADDRFPLMRTYSRVDHHGIVPGAHPFPGIGDHDNASCLIRTTSSTVSSATCHIVGRPCAATAATIHSASHLIGTVSASNGRGSSAEWR